MGRMGLGAYMDKKVETYSKGMKTRLSLVRSLLHDPALLFLDEPTNGLDPTLSRTVCSLISEERDRGKTIFLTTHDMSTAAALCDRVGFLTDGNLALVDTPADLALRFGKREVHLEYRSDGRRTVSFPMPGLAANDEFLRLLRSGRVETMHSAEAGLGDIFRKVTGRNLA
ncbi:MAG: ABC transporter ATP-binding protein [Spirochaetaceae bacterium]|nr:ABC transporter ATP-binding protein [Spirochaetaceae bacterium]